MVLQCVVPDEAPFLDVNTPLKTLVLEYIDARLRREAIAMAE